MLQLKLSVQLACLGVPLKAAFPLAAELGAAGVEIDARRELVQPVSRTAVRQILKYLDDYRLRIACLTFPIRNGLADLNHLERRLEAIKDTMRLAYQLRSNCVVCDIGSIPLPEQSEERRHWLDIVNEIGRFAQREGAFLAARTGIAPPAVLSQFLQECDPGSLMISFDPANIVLHGNTLTGAASLLGPHTVHLHVRDAVRDFSARRAVEVEVGRGSVDWNETLAALEQGGFHGYATVGREGSSNPKLECQQAAEYLQNLFQ